MRLFKQTRRTFSRLLRTNSKQAAIRNARHRERKARLELLERRELLAVITTLSELQSMSLSGDHVLGADIDASTAFFTPLGTAATPFTGSLDGNGYKITGLKMNTSSQYAGLFGYASGASITDVILENVDINSSYYSDGSSVHVGGLAGRAFNTAITGSRVTGDIDVSSYGGVFAGGLVGYGSTSTDNDITTSSANVDINAQIDVGDYGGYGGYGEYGYVGGLIGYASNIGIDQSSAEGSAVAYGGYVQYGGGLAGFAISTANDSITKSKADVDINADADSYGGYGGINHLGGLIGYVNDVDVDESSAAGNVYAYGGGYQYTGGLIGYSYLYSGTGAKSINVTESFASGNAQSVGEYGGGYGGVYAYSGGLIGYSLVATSGAGSGGAIVEQSYATGDAYSNDGSSYGGSYGGAFAGGLIGYNYLNKAGTTGDADVVDSYAWGDATAVTYGGAYAGGLIGYSYATGTTADITRAYALGVPLTQNASVFYKGGLAGYAFNSAYSANHWGTQTSGVSDGVDNIDPDPAGVSGQTTANMRRQSTFSGWDFDVNGTGPGANGVWIMAGYPHLQMEHKHMKTGSKVVENVVQLQMMSLDLAEDYVLANDIDASDTATWNWNGSSYQGFAPVGSEATNFTGSFDGQGHVISELTIYRPASDELGLFGFTGAAASLANVGLVDVDIDGYGAASDNIGGLAGKNKGTISYAYAVGAVDGNDDVGGLVGENEGGLIENSYADVTIPYHANSDDIGGLVGDNDGGTIRKSFGAGSVASNFRGGGLAGQNKNGGVIEDSYATADVTGGWYIGGLVGLNSATVTRSYSTGAVSGSSSVGGVIGYSSGATYTANYWDTQTSGTSDGVGNINPDPSGVEGKTTQQMHTQSTFSGWDFDDVWIMAGYPHLRMENSLLPTVEGRKLVRNVVELQLMAVDLEADYLLAGDIDAAMTDEWNWNGSEYEGFAPIGRDTDNSFTATGHALEGVDFDGDAFTGSLDGDGHTIEDLYIDRPTEDFVGLFGAVLDDELTLANYLTHDAAILDLTLENPVITGRRFIGGLAGLSDAKIKNSSVTATEFTVGVTSAFITAGGSLPDANNTQRNVGFAIGGLVGKSGTDDNSVSVIDSSSTQILVQHNGATHLLNVGGLAGQVNDSGRVINSSAAGDVIAQEVDTSYVFRELNEGTGMLQNATINFNNHVGGLVGEQDGDVTGTVVGGQQQYSEASGRVTAYRQVGGLIGALDGTVSFGRSVSTGANANPVLGEDQVGGLIGRIDDDPGAAATQSFAQRIIGSAADPVDDEAGGFVGSIVPGGAVSLSSATSTVFGSNQTGGFVGHNEGGTITRSSATSTVTGVDKSGGFAGKNTGGTISRSSATTTVSGNHHTGGFVGENEGGTISDSFVNVTMTFTNGPDNNDEGGGFAGQNSAAGIITRSYAVGTVTSVNNPTRVGGFVGDNNDNFTTITDSFADVTMVGGGNGFFGRQNAGNVNNFSTAFDPNAGGVTPAALRAVVAGAYTHAVYLRVANPWDFTNIWIVNAGNLPTLQ